MLSDCSQVVNAKGLEVAETVDGARFILLDSRVIYFNLVFIFYLHVCIW